MVEAENEVVEVRGVGDGGGPPVADHTIRQGAVLCDCRLEVVAQDK